METTGFAVPVDDYSLVAFLNSKVVWFVLKSLTPRARGNYFRMKAQYLSQTPIPEFDAESRTHLILCAKTAQEAAEDRLVLQRALTRRIPDLCSNEREPKLTKKLQEWWKLPDFPAFRAEVKKALKVDIPLAERSAWEDWITRDRAEIARLSAVVVQAEARIDSIVYGLFDLTSDEIELLESAI